MAVTMMLGAFAFEARDNLGFDAIQHKVQTPWADVAVAQTLNQQQWTGPTSDEITIKGCLFPVEFGGQGSLDGLIAAAKSGVPLMLVSGDDLMGTIHGTYTIQSIDEDRSYFTAFGTPRRNAYSIVLKRYGQSVGGGSLLSPILDIFR